MKRAAWSHNRRTERRLAARHRVRVLVSAVVGAGSGGVLVPVLRKIAARFDVWTKLNGRIEQQGNTSDMLFSIDTMLAYFSTHMALLPGDLLATGTPPGVGFGKNRFMAVGDVLECGISELGAQRHEILA